MSEWLVMAVVAVAVSVIWYIVMKSVSNKKLRDEAAVFGMKAALYAGRLIQDGMDDIPAMTVESYAKIACESAVGLNNKGVCDAVAKETYKFWQRVQDDDVLLAEIKRLAQYAFGNVKTSEVRAALFPEKH